LRREGQDRVGRDRDGGVDVDRTASRRLITKNQTIIPTGSLSGR